MESRFGHDFSGVRVHDDPVAAESARAVNARAYTVGEDIAFASGQYDPNSHSGSHLLAHELAHTIQQRGLQRSSNGVSMSHDSEYVRLEREADSAAAAVTKGATPNVTRSASQPILSRADPTTPVPRHRRAGEIHRYRKKQSRSSELTRTTSVTPTEVYTTPSTAATLSLRRVRIDVFYHAADERTERLRHLFSGWPVKDSSQRRFAGTGKTKTALWQERPVTEDLQVIWVQKVGWVGGEH